jgi:5'-AMP-activated protein kinase catalytic alpha subunit
MESEIVGFVFERRLEFTASSSLWCARHKGTDLPVSIRVIPKCSLTTPDAQSRLQHQINILKQLDHPSILSFFDCIETDSSYNIVMEYVEHWNVLDYIRYRGRFTEEHARRCFMQLMHVMDYLHNMHQIPHCAIRCENILIDRQLNIRVAGFIDLTFRPVWNLGSPYAAPETIRDGIWTRAADLWSCGIVLYTILVGISPFDNIDTELLWRQIQFSDVYYPWFLSIEAIDLIEELMDKDPEHRISIQMITDHPWLRSEFCAPEWASALNPDPDIVARMTARGIDCRGLARALGAGEHTQLTATYRIYRRALMIEQTRDRSNTCAAERPALAQV